MKSTPSNDWDRRIGATLAFLRTRDCGQTQAGFARRFKIKRTYLASIESGRSPLRSLLGWQICRSLGLNPTWLCAAANSDQPNVFPEIPEADFAKIEPLILASKDQPFREIWPAIAGAFGIRVEKNQNKGLTNMQGELDMPARLCDDARVKANPVVRSLDQLLDAVRSKLKERGQKAALAKRLGVSRQAVDQWLSGDAKPSSDLTFELINWVCPPERQSK